MFRSVLGVVVLLSGLLLSTVFGPGGTAEAGDWLGFQNGGNPVSSDERLPTRWSPESGIVWQQATAGYGQSSPVVAGGRVFVTSVSGARKETLHIEAFDLKSGERKWYHTTKNSSPAESSNYISKAAPTPVCDDSGVVALFEGGNVLALTSGGKLRWERDLVADYGAIEARHGLGASLEQNDRLVFVWIERQEQPYVLALSKDTGETIWKVEGQGVTSWSSPRLVPVGEERHLVLSGIGKLAGLDPKTGRQLWSLDGIAGNSTPTPMPIGGGRFLIGATVGRGGSTGGNAAASNGVIQISGSRGEGFSAEYVWHSDNATSSFGSPVAHQGRAWFVNRSGVLYVLDLKTGDEQVVKRTASSIWATPIAVGPLIYLFGKDGTTTVLDSREKLDVVAENTLWADSVAAAGGGPAFGGHVLYAVAAADSTLVLRRGDRLYAVGGH